MRDANPVCACACAYERVLEMILGMKIDYIIFREYRAHIWHLLHNSLYFILHFVEGRFCLLVCSVFMACLCERISSRQLRISKLKEPWLFQINEVLSWISIHNGTKHALHSKQKHQIICFGNAMETMIFRYYAILSLDCSFAFNYRMNLCEHALNRRMHVR